MWPRNIFRLAVVALSWRLEHVLFQFHSQTRALILFIALDGVVPPTRSRTILLALQVTVDEVICNSDAPRILEDLYIPADLIAGGTQYTVIGLELDVAGNTHIFDPGRAALLELDAAANRGTGEYLDQACALRLNVAYDRDTSSRQRGAIPDENVSLYARTIKRATGSLRHL